MTEAPNFISIYDNALEDYQCDQIIDEFEKNKERQREGFVGNKEIKPESKLSTDITYNINDVSITSEILSQSLSLNIESYKKENPAIDNVLSKWSCHPFYNVQRYKPGEGYFKQHCEADSPKNAKRVLVWMFYLNSLYEGGTLFPLYNTGVNAVQGRLVIWPAYWTHLHKGQINYTTTKYIATGWYKFVE